MPTQWYILGAGAIGSLFGSALQRAGIPTTLLLRNTDSANEPLALSIERAETTRRLSFPTSNNSDSAIIGHLLITTKAYDVHSALSEVAHRLDANTQIVILVNGMGFMADIVDQFPQLQFTLGTTTQGAYRLAPRHYRHAGTGLTRLGCAGRQKPPNWFADWSRLDLATVWEPNIEQILWQKLCVNCVINPLSALHLCKNGELSARPDLARLVDQLCTEIARVSLAAGFGETATTIHDEVSMVIADTADNRSSMLQDVLAGRRSEIDFISGYFLDVARQFGVAAPLNAAVFEDIRKLNL